ncbi:MAG: hypothetical protein ACKO81_06625 [Planctomycetota bacterium]
MSRKDAGSGTKRRKYDDEFKAQAIQMLLDGTPQRRLRNAWVFPGPI